MEKSTEQLTNELNQLKQAFEDFKNYQYRTHQHNDVDGTNHLRKTILLDQDQGVGVGTSTQVGYEFFRDTPQFTRQQYINSVGADNGATPSLGTKSINAQFDIVHQPGDTNKVSWVDGIRSPLYNNAGSNKLITVTSGGSTVTIGNQTFTTNELTGEIINIYDSSGVFVEAHTIASNTSTVITISGTWLNSTANGFYFVYMPMYVGISEFIWQRDYVQEGTGGGVRFGMGTTGGGQNGLLYMDAAGDVYWRNKAGTSTKLSLPVGLAGTKVYYVANSSGGAVTRKLTFTDGILTSET